MGDLDKMLENQQTEQNKVNNQQKSGSTLLSKISNIYKWLGGLLIVGGIVTFLASVSSERGDVASIGLSLLFVGLFLLFGGCIGEAIDDIRNSVKK